MKFLFPLSGRAWSFKRKIQQFLKGKNLYRILLFFCALLLLYGSHRNYAWVADLQNTTRSMIYQLTGFFSTSKSLLPAQEASLQERLHFWESKARIFASENHKLKQLLQIPPSHYKTLHARVIDFLHNEFGVQLLLNAGKNQGVTLKAPVILGQQVLGRVIEVSENHARVILLFDQSSRIPVLSEQERAHGIVSGDGLKGLTLHLQKASSHVQPGEILQTSGIGGIYPPGLEVGRVSRIEGGKITLSTPLPWDQVEYVEVLLEIPLLPDAAGELHDGS